MSKHIQYTITPASSGLILTLCGRFFSVFPTTSTRRNNGARTVSLGRVSFQFGNVANIQRPARKRPSSVSVAAPAEDPNQLKLEGVV